MPTPHTLIDTTDFAAAVTTLRHAKRIAVLTGAGVSAESGIPTFRDRLTGLWARYQPEYLVSIAAFEREPDVVLRWHNWWREQIADKQPNAAHHALAQWQQQAQAAGKTLTLMSQNVDSLHEAAGADVVKLHGTLAHEQCQNCGMVFEPSHIARMHLAPPATCPHCGGRLRPAIVWFGEMLPPEAWQRAERACQRCDVLVSIGTSSVVYPAAGLIDIAKHHGATVIEINPTPTQTPAVDIVLAGKAGEVLPLLVNALD